MLTFYMAFEVEYFNERVRDVIESWPGDVFADFGRLTDLLIEYGPMLRLPHSRSMGDGLFELRPRGRSGIGRAFYVFLTGRRIVIVHAFIKKSQQTPAKELRLARQRARKIKNG